MIFPFSAREMNEKDGKESSLCRSSVKDKPTGANHWAQKRRIYFLPAFCFAHRARCAAAILARASADILRRRCMTLPSAGAEATPPMTAASFLSSFCIRSLIANALLSCATDKLVKGFAMMLTEYSVCRSKSSQPTGVLSKSSKPLPAVSTPR